MCPILEPNINAQILFFCHIYCAHQCTRVATIVTSSCTVRGSLGTLQIFHAIHLVLGIVRNRLLDQYFLTGFLGRFVSNYQVLDIPDTGSSTGFARQRKRLIVLISTRKKLTKISWYKNFGAKFSKCKRQFSNRRVATSRQNWRLFNWDHKRTLVPSPNLKGPYNWSQTPKIW